MFLYLAMIDSDADKSKFEILYSEYKNLMYYTANRILRNSSDAEDVVHQAFLKVIEILDTISSPRCHKTRRVVDSAQKSTRYSSRDYSIVGKNLYLIFTVWP